MSECNYETAAAVSRLITDGCKTGFDRSLCLAIATVDPAFVDDIGANGFSSDASLSNQDIIKSAIDAHLGEALAVPTDELSSRVSALDNGYDTLEQQLVMFLQRLDDAPAEDVAEMLSRAAHRSDKLTAHVVELLSLQENDAGAVATELKDPCNRAEVIGSLRNAANAAMRYRNERETVCTIISTSEKLNVDSDSRFDMLANMTLPNTRVDAAIARLDNIKKNCDLLSELLSR